MTTRTWPTGIRLVAAFLTVLLASACGDSPQPTEPRASAQFTTFTPTIWQLHVCKSGPDGTTAYFEVTATSGVVKQTNPLAVPSSTTTVSCMLAWEGAVGVPVTITVTEIATPGLELERVSVNKLSAPGYTINGATVTITEEYLASSDVGGFAVFSYKNIASLVPLQVTKTAAGSYEVPVTWLLQKSVTPTSHTGIAGQNAGSSTWTVTATRVEGAPTNHLVSGTITVTNPAAGATQTFSVNDVVNGVTAVVNCPTYTLDPGQSATCTYSAAVAGATLNTATVSSSGYPDVSASAAVSYNATFTGDQTVMLADPRFTYAQAISSSTTVEFPETFPCPADASQYTNGTHNRTETNNATLTGPNTDLSATATVNITCTYPSRGETATGQGFPWSATQGAPSNWFMYTPWSTTSGHRGISASASGSTPAGTNLIAAQHYVAGRITGTRSGSVTSITITLNSSWGFDNAIGNVKINPMSCTTAQPYVQPGGFAVHRTAAASATSITITGLPNTACYGIHVDVVEK